MDEAFLALNILDRPFGELFGQLSFNQAAPPAFLLVEHVDVALFGRSEYALRLFPLACGIASIFLFWIIAHSLLDRRAALVSLFLFTVADGLVYYSSELKHYSTDVAATLVIYIAGLALHSKPVSRVTLLGWAVLGAAVVWFSYAAALAATAVIIVLIVLEVLRRRWAHLRAVSLVAAMWAASLAGLFWYAHGAVSHLLSSFRGETASDAFSSSGESVFPTGVAWLRNPAGAIANLLGIPAGGVLHLVAYGVAIVALIGAVALARRAPDKAAILAMPIPVTLAAASFESYPILQRTILFWLPFVVLIIGAGVALAGSGLRRRGLIAVVAVTICALPAATSGNRLLFPYQGEDVKPLMSHLEAEWREGDSLYLSPRAQYAVRYYIECDCIQLSVEHVGGPWDFGIPTQAGSEQYAPALFSKPPRFLVGVSWATLAQYVGQVDVLRGQRRAWLLVTRANRPERALLAYLSRVGRRVSVIDQGTASLYLYDFAGWRTITCAQGVRTACPR